MSKVRLALGLLIIALAVVAGAIAIIVKETSVFVLCLWLAVVIISRLQIIFTSLHP